MQGKAIEISGTASVVIFDNGEDSTTVLCGFSIQKGVAAEGGGIFCENSSPRLDNMMLFRNVADGFNGDFYYPSGKGGGLYCNNSSPSLTNVTLRSNRVLDGSGGRSAVPGYGGGIYCINGSNPSLENVIIMSDTASIGAGIYCANGSRRDCFLRIKFR